MIGWAIEALLASALLMVVVLAARGPVRALFGPHVAYALWAIPVLRLLLPPLPAGWRGGMLPQLPAPWRGGTLPDLPVGEPLTVLIGAPAAGLPAAAPVTGGIGWAEGALLLWGAGAAALLVWQVLHYARFRHRVLHHGIAVDRVRSVTVVRSAAATGPLAFGVFDRVVAFPRDFAARFDVEEQALALEHELGHHARGDLIANWVALAVLAVHWFNPVAWIAFRAFRADQEMANDAHVLAKCGAAARHAYGCAIVKAAHGRAVSPACHLNTVKDLKGRLRMLGRKNVSRGRVAMGAGAAGALALGTLAMTASGTQAAERMRIRVETATGVEIAGLQPVAALHAAVAPIAPVAPDLPSGEAAPVVPAVPAVPPVPAAPTAPTPPETGQHDSNRVVVVENGKRTVYDGAEADAWRAAHPLPAPPMPPVPPSPTTKPVMVIRTGDVPQVVERTCAPGEGGTDSRMILVQARDGDKRVMTVCTNRIDEMARRVSARATADAERIAGDSKHIERDAKRTAIASLYQARAGLYANRALSAEQRRLAVSGIDEAIAELRAEVAARD